MLCAAAQALPAAPKMSQGRLPLELVLDELELDDELELLRWLLEVPLFVLLVPVLDIVIVVVRVVDVVNVVEVVTVLDVVATPPSASVVVPVKIVVPVDTVVPVITVVPVVSFAVVDPLPPEVALVLLKAPPEFPMAPVSGPAENDPHATAPVPSATARWACTTERIFFIATSPGGGDLAGSAPVSDGGTVTGRGEVPEAYVSSPQ